VSSATWGNAHGYGATKPLEAPTKLDRIPLRPPPTGERRGALRKPREGGRRRLDAGVQCADRLSQLHGVLQRRAHTLAAERQQRCTAFADQHRVRGIQARANLAASLMGSSRCANQRIRCPDERVDLATAPARLQPPLGGAPPGRHSVDRRRSGLSGVRRSSRRSRATSRRVPTGRPRGCPSYGSPRRRRCASATGCRARPTRCCRPTPLRLRSSLRQGSHCLAAATKAIVPDPVDFPLELRCSRPAASCGDGRPPGVSTTRRGWRRPSRRAPGVSRCATAQPARARTAPRRGRGDRRRGIAPRPLDPVRRGLVRHLYAPHTHVSMASLGAGVAARPLTVFGFSNPVRWPGCGSACSPPPTLSSGRT
jgi:hypothetical protein